MDLRGIRGAVSNYLGTEYLTQPTSRYYMLVPSADWQPMIQKLELKLLCSLILERTINDPDKYQSGLTKIFFRAGMLAALESLRSERLNALVTIVQKNMRRRVAVKRYQELRSATIKIQTWWRGILARRLVETIRKDVAAKRLQAGIRRFLQRSNFLQIRQAVIAVQSRTSKRSQPKLSSLIHALRSPWCTGTTSAQGGEDSACGCVVAIPVPWSVCSLFLVSFSILINILQIVPPFISI